MARVACQYPSNSPNQQPSPIPSYTHHPSPVSPQQSLGHANWTVEDPDLMPTQDDWTLVYRYITNNGQSPPVMFSIDGDLHLRNYFRSSPALRLISAAVSAHVVTPPVPETIALSYYKRARKAIAWAMNQEQTVETIQSLYWLYLFSTWKGQPVIGRAFLKMALEVILNLRMNIDPDDSPWLYHLNLSPREKEGRRRAFWASYQMYQWEYALSIDTEYINISDQWMKPPTQIYDPHLIFTDCRHAKAESAVYALLGDLKRHLYIPPNSINDLFGSKATAALNSRLIQIHQSAPIDILLIAESSFRISESDAVRFLNQLSAISVQDIPFVFSVNMNLLASASILLRPKLYLSSLKCCVPSFLTPEKHSIIISAIQESLDAANRIACLIAFYMDAGTRNISQGFFFRPLKLLVYPIFDAMIVFWFVKCRMDPVWAPLAGQLFTWNMLKDRVAGMMDFVHKLKETELKRGVQAGAMLPLTQCMEAMMREMESVECGGRREPSPLNNEGSPDFEEIVLGMNMVSLTEFDGDYLAYKLGEEFGGKEEARSHGDYFGN
ncbi:hypothetical protein BCR33DRAFT_784339 [Rhizoclosmatium globosum]|uniref:Transcription factor domain-containing protein n=1 Tax=Rhizoclosmatium globosum TaxID=329046 RepID=A0A1Y2CFJ1_9FUNG|nr:hypothetical protein BCR33DRAFT_784339 [Rhizoclosmatium globosum]|eukprot:ORY45574.1 hypothetical protein BCR33DRAFT_784339 [Rhizoclosmatium globosum]